MKTSIREHNFKLGQTVYHRNVYDHREPLKIVGIRENELELEGDYSGGTHYFCEKDWLPIEGVSRIYNHAYKLMCREYSLYVNCVDLNLSKPEDIIIINKLINMILKLTEEISLNPEY